MIKQKKKKKDNRTIILPEPKDPLDDVKDRKIDRNPRVDIPDPLDDVG